MTAHAGTPRPRSAEASQRRVLAIVATHAGRRWLRECLVALKMQTYKHLDVLVVDDASPDHRVQPALRRISKRHLRGRRWGYLRTPRPLGFGAAINWALSRVRTDAELLLFVHDDAVLSRGAVERMVARIGSEEATAIVGPKIVSWEDPAVLEEVGMAVDSLGYPYKGLEPGEIDLGQHDVPSEVFFVTSTCMLVRHEVFRSLRGFDARMKVFGEDLDLCWRARLHGHAVRMEPGATARHAMALATGQREARFTPARYYIRRNRLRAIAKNASGLRLMALIPFYVLLTFAEMVAFVVLRQPREIVSLARALLWNLLHLPQTIAERGRVQRRRKVPDRGLRRLSVREGARLRFYLNAQAERLEQAWGRRSEIVSSRATRARALTRRMSAAALALALLITLVLMLGFRHFLWGPSVSVNELLPFPEGPTALLRSFTSAWQPSGLGHAGPAPPALVVLGAVQMLALGAAGAAQKVLMVALGAVAFGGAYRLAGDVVDRPARVVAGVVYTLGPVGYAGVRGGALGALVFGAAAPYVLRSLLRITGWTRPSGWYAGRAIARVALGTAVSSAFVPGAVYVYGACAVLLAAARAVFAPRALRSAAAALVGIAAGWALLLPWSATWFSTGGPMARLAEGAAAGLADEAGTAVLLGQIPRAPVLAGVALPLAGLIALAVAQGQRRRVAIALWLLVAAAALALGMTASGALPAVVASATEMGVVASAAFAGLAALAVGAFRLDLPRRVLGRTHALALFGLAAAALLFSVSVGGALWRGEWRPGGSDARLIEQIRSLMQSEAEQLGQFRALWVGPRWFGDQPSPAVAGSEHTLTGTRGLVLNDLFGRSDAAAQARFDAVVASIETGATDRGGALLGAFNVRYVVVDPDTSARAWLLQRDLALARAESDYVLLRNEASLPRAGVYDRVPVYVSALAETDPERAAGSEQTLRARLEQRSPSRFASERVPARGTVFVAEARAPGWAARVGDEELDRGGAAWGNTFVLRGSGGAMTVAYRRPWSWFAWAFLVALGWIVVLGASFSRRRRH